MEDVDVGDREAVEADDQVAFLEARRARRGCRARRTGPRRRNRRARARTRAGDRADGARHRCRATRGGRGRARATAPSTHAAVSTAIAKPRPCERAMIAVLTPSTRPRASSSGPAGVAGVERRGVLDDAIDQAIRAAAQRAAERGDDAGRDGRLEAERVADRDRELADLRRERAVDGQVGRRRAATRRRARARGRSPDRRRRPRR